MIHRKARSLMSVPELVAAETRAAYESTGGLATRASGSAAYHNPDGSKTIIGPVSGNQTLATHVGDTTPPPPPAGIACWSGDGSVHVSWDGTLAADTPADFFAVRIIVDGTEVGMLREAGSVTASGWESGTEVSITATSEDDVCLADGTPAHNVSEPSEPMALTVMDNSGEALNAAQGAVDSAQSNAEAIDAANKALAQATADINQSIAEAAGVVGELRDQVAGISGNVTDLSSMVRIDESTGHPALIMGDGSADLMVQLTDSQLSFVDGGQIVAYINGKALNIATANVEGTLRFGGFGFAPRNNGNMCLKWMGGDA